MMRLLLPLLIAMPAYAVDDHSYDWERVVDVADVQIEMRQVSTWELRAVKRRYGDDARRKSPGLKAQDRHQGFAVLFRGPDGYRCEVYYSDARERVTAHEERHCYGWSH